MRSVCGRGSEGAVVCYRFGEEKGAEEEEEGFGSVMFVRKILHEFDMSEIFTFPRISSCNNFELILSLGGLRSVECAANV